MLVVILYYSQLVATCYLTHPHLDYTIQSSMALNPPNDAGTPNSDLGSPTGQGGVGPKVLGGRRLFMKKVPGSPGKLGKSSTKAESLSKLRGKGALA